MKYIIDHDLHIHSHLSPCSGNPQQTGERIFEYAKDEGYSKICVTDHFWDSDVNGVPYDYRNLNQELLSKIKPLPQSDEIKFLFGCEAEINPALDIGLAPENAALFDFIIIPTTHLHMQGVSVNEEDVDTLEKRAKQWIWRFERVLDSDLPHHKVGIAHLVCHLMAPRPYKNEDVIKILDLISDSEMERLFSRAAELGIGIELNASDFNFEDEYKEFYLRPFKIAKKCGCKFYLGSDSHTPGGFEGVKERFERAVNLLELKESDKFKIEIK